MVVSIRSMGYGSEWASNARVGLKGDHEGFSKAAKAVYNQLEKYVNKYDIDKIWICGFSRGGAVSNVLGKLVIDHNTVPSGNLYCYTFEAPYTTNSITSSSDGEGIYNTVLLSDPIPQVPLATWGFHRYGHNMYISLKTSSNYKNVIKKVKKNIMTSQKMNIKNGII